MKGGHVPGDSVIDLLMTPAGETILEGPRIATRHTHGTGCTLASACAVGLAQGLEARGRRRPRLGLHRRGHPPRAGLRRRRRSAGPRLAAEGAVSASLEARLEAILRASPSLMQRAGDRARARPAGLADRLRGGLPAGAEPPDRPRSRLWDQGLRPRLLRRLGHLVRGRGRCHPARGCSVRAAVRPAGGGAQPGPCACLVREQVRRALRAARLERRGAGALRQRRPSRSASGWSRTIG